MNHLKILKLGQMFQNPKHTQAHRHTHTHTHTHHDRVIYLSILAVFDEGKWAKNDV
jgi:hypothetical protein